MRIIILWFLAVSLLSCNSNDEVEKIEIFFYPSFMPPTKFTIDINNQTIEEYTFRNTYFSQRLFDATAQKPYKKDSISTKIYYQKIFEIDKQVLRDFLNVIELIKLDSILIHRNEGILDGIGFGMLKISSNRDTVGLGSNLLFRNEASKVEYSFLDPFFCLSYKTINDDQGLSILENIQNYFSYD